MGTFEWVSYLNMVGAGNTASLDYAAFTGMIQLIAIAGILIFDLRKYFTSPRKEN